ncbi:gamma-glutamyltransferase, partial [Pelomonas sp. KK5]|uniref:gamma-glutamyltransferase n=1 Tax=Pelomonas sp. KK5 TaxID=1855730 RepID=UPI0018E9B099
MKGIVTSPHAVASRCGAQVLADGGNAVEAAIATALALSVTMPHFCGLAGDAFLLVGDAGGEVRAISGIGQAAADLTGYEGGIPVRGPRSALTSAGTLDALRCAFETGGGRMSWADLVAPALALAREGFETTASERFWREFRRAEAGELPG